MAGPQAAGNADGSPQHTPNLSDEQRVGLSKMRERFPDTAISKLPRSYCRACSKSPSKVCSDHKKIRCPRCKANVTEAHIDLDYVGHAELTDRLLDADPAWDWEPVAWGPDGLPQFDRFGGLWIRLTVCGVTRMGYGDAGEKDPGPNAVKEIIGDALRNAAMRFGAALDLWAKTDLHADETPEAAPQRQSGSRPAAPAAPTRQAPPRPHAGEQGGQAEPSAANSAPAPNAREFADFKRKVANGWNHPGATEMAIKEAEQKGWINDQMPGPDGQLYQVGLLLAGRLAELKTQQQEPQGGQDLYAASGIAGGQNQQRGAA